MVDFPITYLINSVGCPYIIAKIHNGEKVETTDSTVNIFIGDSKHIELLSSVGTKTGGKTSIQFNINVIDHFSGKKIKTYTGKSLLLSNSTDSILIDNGLLGDTVNVEWVGTLDSTSFFEEVYCTLIAKR